MGSIRRNEGKRGITWTADYMTYDGKRPRPTFDTLKKAKNHLAKVGVDLSGQLSHGKKIGNLTDRYDETCRHQKSYGTGKKYLIQSIRGYFGVNKGVPDIEYSDLEDFRRHWLECGKKEATVNRHQQCLRHMLNKAVEWKIIARNPFQDGERLILKESNERRRCLTEDEITRLIKECTEDLRPVVICALNTGLLKSEILNLKFNQIKNGAIYLNATTATPARQVPINEDLALVFKRLNDLRYTFSEYVFKIRRTMARSFKSSVKRAGILDFTFNDLRYTFGSHYIRRGGDLRMLQLFLGHNNIRTTEKTFGDLVETHKKDTINLLCGLTKP